MRCKGTTKNAHTQAKRALFVRKIIDVSIQMVFITHLSSLKNEVMDSRDKAKPYFSTKSGSVARVWACVKHAEVAIL